MPIVHGVNASPFVRKVRVGLAEKNLDYDLEPVMPIGVSDEFREISPLGKIPVYQDGDYTLPDSSCILAYLDRVHPDPPLYPEDPQQFGTALFLEEYGDTKLAEALLPIFFQRIVVAKIMKGAPDEATIRSHLNEHMPAVFDYLETIVGDNDGVVGGRFSVADIALASPIVNLEHAGETIDGDRWPRLEAYRNHVFARPSFKGLIEEEKAALAAM